MQREKTNFHTLKIQKKVKSISINAEQRLTYFNSFLRGGCTPERFASKV